MTLQTAANSALPAAGFRKKIAADQNRTEKHAAGVLYVAPDGDVLLLRRSSAEANFAGHWALPGGGVEAGETPQTGAARESREEMGVDVDPAGFKPLDRRVTPTGTTFHTFARPVPDKFVPKLNPEHSGYAWAPLDMLPRPLHPAVEQTLKEQVGVGEDMAPEDWKGLRDGFLKWTSEEEREPEHAADSKLNLDLDDEDGQLAKLLAYIKKNSEVGHSFDVIVDPSDPEMAKKFYIDGDGAFRIRDIVATDSALRLALDKDTTRDKSKDGHLHVSQTNISKATVNPYRGAEIPNHKELGLDPQKIYHLLRDPEELAKAANTFNGKPLLRTHVPVTSEKHAHDHTIGATGTNARFEDPYLKNDLVIWPQSDIDDVESEAKKELSSGYHYRAEMTPGNFRGMRFDGIMRDIVGNHVALVKDGRAGPDVVVGDSMENLMAKPTRLAALTLGTIAAALTPMIAMDQRIELPKKLFDDITSKNFAAKKAELLAGVSTAAKGKLRKGLALDASMAEVGKVMDAVTGLMGGAEGVDESVSEEQHKAMEAAANGESNLGIPKKVGEEFAEKDKGKAFDAEPIKAFMREKGMSEDDIMKACDMMPKAMAGDEVDEAEDEAETEAEKKKAEAEKAAKDAEMKNMVTKPAMDAAINAASEATAKRVRAEERELRLALDEVRPYVGELPGTLALDSAEAVRRHALDVLKVPGAKDIHASALSTILGMQPRAGARPADVPRPMGMDAAASKDFNDRFAGAARIGSV